MNIQNLYYARIKKIEFINFRNIEMGTVEFPNSKTSDFLAGSPSIIGLYGQNGSGKSSVIMALGILKDVLSGNSINEKYESSIRYGCERSTLKFSFAMYSKVLDDNGTPILNDEASICYDVFYDFDIARVKEEREKLEITENLRDCLCIENESIKFRATDATGKVILPKQTFIDTRKYVSNKKSSFFGSEEKEKIYSNNNTSIKQQYRESFAVSFAKSQSFIFSHKTINLLRSTLISKVESMGLEETTIDVETFTKALNDIENPESIEMLTKFFETEKGMNYVGLDFLLLPVNLIENLRLFGTTYLHVIDTVTTGITNINSQLPLLLWLHQPNNGVYNYRISLEMDGLTHVPENSFKTVKQSLMAVSDVLEKIVPGVRLNFVDLGIRLSNKNTEEHYFEITAQRGAVTIPLRYESDGIRRIVSILSLLIAAYNDDSFTVAIDEIDSGIFEYLLGEILLVMSESVKGQLIFTSHNLRALEVLPSKYLCFTTTDPENRFTKISSRGNNNLRDTYFRSIVLNTQKDSIYMPTDKYEIELAFYRAGHIMGDYDE